MQERDTTPRFGAIAPAYWAAGLPVIPLHYREKSPIMPRWTTFCSMMPTEEQRQEWMHRFLANNIGLPLGEASKVVILDIDTDNDIAINTIMAVAGRSPWERRGRKGKALAYRWRGERSFQIKDDNGKVVVELLAQGRQVVLPPSIHPDTQMEYVANCDLASVASGLAPLPDNIDVLLRGALEAAGIKLLAGATSRVVDFVSAGARDSAMTRMAGLLSWAVQRGERSFKEAEGMLRVWHANLVEKVAGDDIDINRGVANLAKFLVKDVTGPKKVMLPKGWDDGMTIEEKTALGLHLEDEHVEWPFEQIRDHLKDEFQKHDRSSPHRAKAAQQMIARVAHSPNLSEMEREMLFKYMSENVGNLTISAIRKELRGVEGGGMDGVDHAEIAQAVIDDLSEFGEMRAEAGSAWQWLGSSWVKMDDDDLLKHIIKNYGHKPAGKRATDHKGILQTVKTSLVRGLKTVDVEGVNFANGFVDRRPSLLAHDPSYGCTYTLPFRYLDKDVGRPSVFFDYLEQSWGGDPDYGEKVEALQEAICATIYGIAYELQRCFLIYGVANSGKSVLIDIVASLMPTEARCAVSPAVWGDKFAPMAMHGKLLNVCGELSAKSIIRGDTFKAIVSGDEISAAYKGRDPVAFKPKCANWFASNHLPRTDDTSDGFNRRWLIFTFNRAVSEEKKVLRLAEMIVAEEREKIVSWAIQAIERLTKRKNYTLPASHKIRLEQMAVRNSSVRHFISAEAVRLGSNGGNRITATELLNRYFNFCVKEGVARRASRGDFCTEMSQLQTEFHFLETVTREETFYDFRTPALN